MNILLIAPATGTWRRLDKRAAFNGRTFRFSMLSLLTVAALSPKNARVTLVDEQVQEIPEGDFDLVGITAMTAVAPRAYELCRHFREKGTPVVLGGYHATLNPEEALEHADAIVEGHAYGAWERVCEDVRNGTLGRRYRGSSSGPVPVHLPRRLLDSDKYVTVSSVFATMGCKNHCKFCSIRAFHQGERFVRPIEEVRDEVAALPQRFFLFVDDNLTQDRDYALALFKAMRPLGKRWATQVSIDVAEDAELLDAMAQAGCTGVFIGLETFNAAALRGQSKCLKAPQHYATAVQAFHRRGVFVEAGMIVGFDTDDTGVFRATLDMLESAGIDAVQLAILTPLPGTELFESMRRRVFDLNWEHYDYRHVVFEPKHLRRGELQAGADWLIRTFYSPWRIARRAVRWLRMPGGIRNFVYPLGLNLAYYGRVRAFGIRGYDPAIEYRTETTCVSPTATQTGETTS